MVKALLEVELDGVTEQHERDALVLALEQALAGETIYPARGATLSSVVVDSATVTELDGSPVP